MKIGKCRLAENTRAFGGDVGQVTFTFSSEWSLEHCQRRWVVLFAALLGHP